MKLSIAQKAAVQAANAILAEAGLPQYSPRHHPKIDIAGATAPISVDLSRLVKVSSSPFQGQWEVAGGTGKWLRRIGRHVGSIEISNSRAHGILLQFPDGQLQSFHPIDLFPWTGPQVVFDNQLEVAS
ncbi:hypothetical protein APB26_32205 [Pseudomonas aeruginosa]|uniref:hypothetical protein n=1 Tax=Pseudomonas aeruginosa TaxID=287 RepID=UPI00071BDADA|nr:hypothetical protein [Pseudomonas aeruginosa]KSQ21649.1 hypothetical protein APB26_32205 [Pseudomonas aeruginosa]RPV61319.1 hypothetical protein IPC838_18540 [Pseudomonas aeruginosa]